MTVLITGAAGFVGSHLAERCLSLGSRVIGIDSFSNYYAEPVKRANIAVAAEHPDYTLIEGDLCDLDLAPILADASIVFHLAAQPGVRTSWDDFGLYTNLNLNATQRLLDAARKASVERVVIASSSSIYGDAETSRLEPVPHPVSPYGITKVATEQLAQVYYRSFGVPTVCLRYFRVYGPRQRPDMAFNRLIGCAGRRTVRGIRRRKPDTRFHVRGRCRERHHLGGECGLPGPPTTSAAGRSAR